MGGSHDQYTIANERRLKLALALTSAFLAVEVVDWSPTSGRHILSTDIVTPSEQVTIQLHKGAAHA